MRLFVLTMVVLMVSVLGAACFAEGPAPLAVVNKAIGGGALNQYTPGVEGGQGLNNIGLLIRTWGKVTFVDASTSTSTSMTARTRGPGSGQRRHQGQLRQPGDRQLRSPRRPWTST